MPTIYKTAREAIRLGANEFGLSHKPNRLYYVMYYGKEIHFGKKKGKNNETPTKDRTTPDFWEYNLL